MTEVMDFVLFVILLDRNEYENSCSFSRQPYFEKGSHINFSFDYKEICLFYGYFEDI